MPYIGRELESGNYLKLDDISSSFNGSLTTFNLTAAGKAFFPGSSFSILVVLSGVIQEPNAAYQVNNSQITFASAPASGADFYCIVLGVAHGVNVPGNGTVDGAQLKKPFNYDGYFYLDDTNNRVGVGTATPAKPLHVVGEGQFDSVRVLGDLTVDGTTTTLDTVVTEVDRLEVKANNSTVAIAVTQSGSGDVAHFMGGNIGIGTDNPQGKLVVSNGSTGLEFNPNSQDAVVSYNRVTSAYAPVGLQGSTVSLKIGGVGTALQIDSAGKIGIGTNNPAKILDVQTPTGGRIQFDKAGSDGSRILFAEADGTLRAKINSYGGSNETLALDAPTNIDFLINGAEKVRIDSAGSVGIGTISPQSQFEVLGSSPVIRSKNTNQAYTQINHNGTDGYVDWSTGGLILRGASNAERVRITSAGVMVVGHNAATTSGASNNSNFNIVGNIGSATGEGQLNLWKRTAPAADNVLGLINFCGDTTGDPGAIIKGEADADWNQGGDTTDHPSRLTFFTVPDNSSVAAERLRITSAGIVRVPDDGKFSCGAGDDLNIYHSSNVNIIDTPTSRSLQIKGNGITLRTQGNENYIACTENGSVDLYHDNSVRLATTADGVDISGTGSLKVPVGTTAQRSGSPTAGDFRYNSTTGAFEGYTSEWGSIGGSSGITTAAQTVTDDEVHLALSSAQDHKITATGICTIFPGGGTEAESHTVRIINSGIATVGFSTQFLFPSGSEPSLPTADGAISLISFTINKVGVVGIATELLAGASVNYS